MPGAGGGRNGNCLMGTKFQFGKMKRVLEMDGGDGHTIMRMYLIPLNCTVKNGYILCCVCFMTKTLCRVSIAILLSVR